MAKLLAVPGESDERNPVDEQREAALRTLTAFHRTALKAFVEDGLIHSDIHLGNISIDSGKSARCANTVTPRSADEQQSTSDPESQQVSFVLFDVGQFVRVGPADTKALLWALSWISTPHRRATLRSVALKHLVATSSLSSVCSSRIVLFHYHAAMQMRHLMWTVYPKYPWSAFGCGRALRPRSLRVCKVDCKALPRWTSL